MPKALPLRDDYSADELRALSRRTHDANQARRLLALADVREGQSRTQAARSAAMDAQTLRDWVIAFNADGPDGLLNTPPPGRPPKLSVDQKAEIGRFVEAGPDPERDGVVRWRRVDLKAVIWDRYGIDLNVTSVGRLLRDRGFAHVSARPQHPRQDGEAIEPFKKKTSPSASPKSVPRSRPRQSLSCGSRTRCGSARRTAPSINGHPAVHGPSAG